MGTPMEQDLSKKYEEFMRAPGDALTKLRLVGYPVSTLGKAEIGSLEDFRRVIRGIESMDSKELQRELKKVYKSSMSPADLRSFLQMGGEGLDDQELADALRMMPLGEDGSILVDDMVEYLYK